MSRLTEREIMPKCTKCGSTDFKKKYTSKEGVYCVPCKAECSRLYRDSHSSDIKAKQKVYRERNKSKLAVYQKSYRADNKTAIKEKRKAWDENNKGKLRSYKKKYKVAKLQRIPKWLTDFDEFIIEEIYELAVLRSSLLGIEYHVDHIIPLQGARVSGLHVPSNLRILLGKENIAKGNKYVS